MSLWTSNHFFPFKINEKWTGFWVAATNLRDRTFCLLAIWWKKIRIKLLLFLCEKKIRRCEELRFLLFTDFVATIPMCQTHEIRIYLRIVVSFYLCTLLPFWLKREESWRLLHITRSHSPFTRKKNNKLKINVKETVFFSLFQYISLHEF